MAPYWRVSDYRFGLAVPVSSIPTLPHFFHAILSVLRDRAEGMPRQDVYEPVAERVGLTSEQRAERLPGGAAKVARYRHRVGWGLSSFTREARQYADTLSEALVLIDGPRLAALMIDAGVGVTTYRTIQLCRLDGDYFEEG